jgi:hypothetical protein
VKKVLFLILALALALGLALPMASPAAAHTEDHPFRAQLWAGQSIPVGYVEVWNDDDFLYVTYHVYYGDWQLVETHVAVADSLAGIPQTNSGNPKVGNFPYSDPAGDYEIPLTWGPDTTLFIATHAVVYSPSCGQETAWPLRYCDGGNWASGPPLYPFPGKSWATYFTYTVQ